MLEFEQDISAVKSKAADIARRAKAIDRWVQNGMLDLRGLDLRQSINDLQAATSSLQKLADKYEPYQQAAE